MSFCRVSLAFCTLFKLNVTIYDPWAKPEEVNYEYGITSLQQIPSDKFDAIVLTVAHNEFKDLNIEELKNPNAVVYDVKSFLESYTKKL